MEADDVAQNAARQAAPRESLILLTIPGAVCWFHEVQSRLDGRHASGCAAGFSENPQSDASGAETRPGCGDVLYPAATDREVFLRVTARRLGPELMKKVYGWQPDR